MASDEYNKRRAEIEAVTGKAEWDYDQKPLNESARLCDVLRKQGREAGKKKPKEFLEESINPTELQKAYKMPLPPMYLEEHDLKGFNDLEKAILTLHYEDDSLNNQDLARRCNTSIQLVTGLLRSSRVKELEIKYFLELYPRSVRRAYIYLLTENNPKLVERAAEDIGLLKPQKSDINITSKPINDPEALKLLKELGDKLAGGDKDK